MCVGSGSPEGVQPDRARAVLSVGLGGGGGAALGGPVLAVPHHAVLVRLPLLQQHRGMYVCMYVWMDGCVRYVCMYVCIRYGWMHVCLVCM